MGFVSGPDDETKGPADKVERPSLTNRQMANIANIELRRANRSDERKRAANRSADYLKGYAAGRAAGLAAAKRQAKTDAT